MRLLSFILASALALSPTASFRTCNHLNPTALRMTVNCSVLGSPIWVDIYWGKNGRITSENLRLPMELTRLNDDLSVTVYPEEPLEPQFSPQDSVRPGHHLYRGVCLGDGASAEMVIGLLLERIDDIDCYDIRAIALTTLPV